MTKIETYGKNPKLNANAPHCQECMEKDERIKNLQKLVKSLAK